MKIKIIYLELYDLQEYAKDPNSLSAQDMAILSNTPSKLQDIKGQLEASGNKDLASMIDENGKFTSTADTKRIYDEYTESGALSTQLAKAIGGTNRFTYHI